MNHGRILTDFPSEDYYDYIIFEAPRSEHARLVDKPKGKARGGRGQPERIVPEVLENNKQERGYIQT